MLTPKEQNRNWQSVGEQLASFLSARRETITAEWVAVVGHDAKIPSSDNLTLHQLRDHLPELFEKLSATLRNAFGHDTKEEAAHTAAKHGAHRWSTGYDLSELLREYAHVRSAFIAHLIEFEELHPEFGGAARVFAQVTFHRFFDNALRNSVEQFREEQQPEERK